MSEGYVWIVTDGLTADLLSSANHSVTDTMQGVLGVKPYVSRTKELENFRVRWKRKFQQDNPDNVDADLNIYGLWAYDAATALALAVERTGTTNFGFQKANVSSNSSMDLANLGVSLNGPNIIQALSNTSFKGDNTAVPKGWEIPSNGKKLKIGVPVKDGFSQFVSVTRDPGTNTSTVMGFSIDVFEAVVGSLPYALPYEFIPFANPDGGPAGNYDSLIYQVYLQSYTASLTSVLTVQKLQPKVTDVNELIKKGEYVGYREGSFVPGILLGCFDKSKLLLYNSTEECEELFSKGSGNGGIAAAFDEVPYMELFLSKYCSKYTMIDPTFKTGGFAFAFPKGSPLVPDVSRAILNVTEGDRMKQIEDAWFGKQSTCPVSSTSISSNSLSLKTGQPSSLEKMAVMAIPPSTKQQPLPPNSSSNHP
ncbi:unnamed protein product [Dovyalis caffra]|uniref:Ionotropic glutamate receptor C-terminal domain-containing protein n=1 Tax=Dovyalis caffra TaxID=77055 RepID=A0AAV1SNX7_9ROSI|nr:unnamed protein product [Dovyalis caffra]